MKKYNFFLCSVLAFLIRCNTVFAGWEPVNDLQAPVPYENAQFGYSISVDNGIAAVGAPGRNNSQGAVYVYEIDGLNNWNYVTTLLPPNLNDTDQFGYSVCIDSNKIVVGTYTAEEVYVFEYNGTQWDANPEILSVVSSYYGFGRTVSMDGNTIVVGALGNNNQTGAAYVFDYDGVEWNYKQELTDPFGVIDDDFGCSVAIDGNVIVVGAESDDADSDVDTRYDHGSVSIFRYNGSTWVFEQKFKYPNIYDWAYLGHSVSVAGNTIVAGADQYSEGGYLRAGAVYVYKWNGSSWEENAVLFDPNPGMFDRFGTAVVTDGNTIIVGNEYHDGAGSNSGAAYLFERNGDSWSEGQILENPSGAASDYLGCSVALDGDMVLVGAKWDDVGQSNAGTTFMFLFLAADLNQDGIVNFKDFEILANQWLHIPANPSADIFPVPTGDNFVNILDLNMLTEQWLKTGSPYISSLGTN
jgi:hypothetical protein